MHLLHLITAISVTLPLTNAVALPQFTGFPGGGDPSSGGMTWEEAMNVATVQPDLTGMLPARTEVCTEKLQRKAWQSLTDDEKLEYLNAELCLMWQLPTKTKLGHATSRYDDLVKSHQLQSFLVHGDALFLPYHRLQMHAHERALREECGYTGAQPYWDEESEAGNFTTSTIFDAVTGFGGDGTGTDRCIETGYFANYTLHTGPGYEETDHCITRSISDRSSRSSGTTYVNECLAKTSFQTAWPCMEGSPHNGGHGGVGGEMANPISSPGDPLFYLHHTFLDRVWWRWQELDLESRLTDLYGYTSNIQPTDGWVNATLDTVLNMYGVIPNATVGDVMDIGGDLLCFEYVDPQ